MVKLGKLQVRFYTSLGGWPTVAARWKRRPRTTALSIMGTYTTARPLVSTARPPQTRAHLVVNTRMTRLAFGDPIPW